MLTFILANLSFVIEQKWAHEQPAPTLYKHLTRQIEASHVFQYIRFTQQPLAGR
jgi:hypothetical protein